jgi:oxepin-CoA hydrolase/3-oxo-5,6-dehydrosuberyl-CoA semialdehyde dehydrogenase
LINLAHLRNDARMKSVRSHVGGEWVEGRGKAAELFDPTTEAVVATASTEGIDFRGALAFAREIGGPALRAASFKERGAMIRAASRAIHGARDELMGLAITNGGNTRSDAKFDIDGASGTLAAYADLAEELGDARFLVDGDAINLGRSSRLAGRHLLLPLEGVAVHVNAYNFPAWGLGEKLAVAALAGVPVVSKPATSTALVAARIAEIFVEQSIFPRGAFSFVGGAPGDMLEHLRTHDVLAFTGSGAVGNQLRALPNVVAGSVRVNVEADSLNAAILGEETADDTYDLFLKDVTKEVTQKTGQKCTATRRVFVPRARLEAVREALLDRFAQVKVGDPSRDDVTMGPLATKRQQRDVLEGIAKLVAGGAKVLVGGKAPDAPLGVEPGRGYFVAPTLLEVAAAADAGPVHEHEVFGPVTTLIPYDSVAELIAAVRRGGGGLVSSIYGDDKGFLRDVVFGIATAHGRVVIGSEKNAGAALSPGLVMPQLVHGGPGRAGGGEELGGARGLRLYLQRTALQGYGPLLQSLVEAGKQV